MLLLSGVVVVAVGVDGVVLDGWRLELGYVRLYRSKSFFSGFDDHKQTQLELIMFVE